MEKLCIEQAERSSEVIFSHGGLRLWKTFIPVDAAAFYIPFYEWIEKYSIDSAAETVVRIGIQYTGLHWMRYIQKLLEGLILLKTE